MNVLSLISVSLIYRGSYAHKHFWRSNFPNTSDIQTFFLMLNTTLRMLRVGCRAELPGWWVPPPIPISPFLYSLLANIKSRGLSWEPVKATCTAWFWSDFTILDVMSKFCTVIILVVIFNHILVTTVVKIISGYKTPIGTPSPLCLDPRSHVVDSKFYTMML